MEQVTAFVNDPLVAPLWGVFVLGIADMGLGIYQALRQGAFDLAKLPSMLDACVLRKVVPLAALGVAGFVMTDGPTRSALLAAYGALSLAALAAEAKNIVEKVTGGYTATTVEQDRTLKVPPITTR